MKNDIRTYEDLIRKQQQMDAVLLAQKELVIQDFRELKEEFRPAVSALGFLGKITKRDRTNSLLSVGAGNLVDLFMKKVVLARAGWLTKLVVPFFLKNYSSNFVAEHKDEFIDKIRSWISPKNGNGKEAPTTSYPDTDFREDNGSL